MNQKITAGVIADSGPSSSSFQSPTTSDSEERKSGDKEDLLQMDKDAEEDIAEFEELELQYDLMLSSHFSRSSCFAHTLQLVVGKSDSQEGVTKSTLPCC